MRNGLIFRVATCAGSALFGLALAADAAQFTYNGFSNTTGLTFVGDAATAVTSDGTVLRVTPATGNQSGAVYSTSAFTLGANDTFSTQFQFRFTDPGSWDPADGITFVLAASPTGLGAGGVGMGYSGVPNSVAIEFDTYNNAGFGLGDNDGNSSNHVAIDTDGNLTNSALANVYGNGSCGFATGNPPQDPQSANGCMSNGHLWTVDMSYDGADLTVKLRDPAESSDFVAIDSYPIDIASYLGTNSAYVGFTAGTGAGWENHDIVNWTFANTSQIPQSSVPEPGSLILMSAGALMLVGAAASRRLRRQN